MWAEIKSKSRRFIYRHDSEAQSNLFSDAPVGILEASGVANTKFEDNVFHYAITRVTDPPPARISSLAVPERSQSSQKRSPS